MVITALTHRHLYLFSPDTGENIVFSCSLKNEDAESYHRTPQHDKNNVSEQQPECKQELIDMLANERMHTQFSFFFAPEQFLNVGTN